MGPAEQYSVAAQVRRGCPERCGCLGDARRHCGRRADTAHWDFSSSFMNIPPIQSRQGDMGMAIHSVSGVGGPFHISNNGSMDGREGLPGPEDRKQLRSKMRVGQRLLHKPQAEPLVAGLPERWRVTCEVLPLWSPGPTLDFDWFLKPDKLYQITDYSKEVIKRESF